MSDTEHTAPQQGAQSTIAPGLTQGSAVQGGAGAGSSAGFQQKVARRLARKGVSVNGALATPPTAYGLSSYNYAPALRAVALSEVADSIAAGSGDGQRQMQADHGPQAHGPATAPALSSAGDVAAHGFSGQGHAVPHKAQMEQSFGMNFDHVTAYSDAPARKANEGLNSHAYAMNNQVAFKSSNPSPELVAHELTHTIQHGGVAAKGGGDSGIDTSGEAEAEAVESAVRAGKPARTAMTSLASPSAAGPAQKSASKPAQKAKGPARSEEGGGSKFGMGMSFSLEGFEKSYSYTLWKGHYAWPTPVPGLNFVIDPLVTVAAKGGVKWGGESKGDAGVQLGVGGEVGIGLSGGIPNVAEIYGTINPGIEGVFTLTKHAKKDEHAETTAPAQGHAEPKKETGPASDWSLQGLLAIKGSAKVGVSLAGGIIDNSFELGNIEICKLTGVYFDQTGFRRDKLGFEWGPKIKEAYEWIKKAIDKAKSLGRAGIEAAKRAGGAIASGAQQLAHWVTSW